MQRPGDSPSELDAEASQATRDLRHSSQLENWILRGARLVQGIASSLSVDHMPYLRDRASIEEYVN